MRSTAATLLLLLGAAAALAACGVSEETKVRAVAQEFRRAIDAGDGERACRLLTARARDAIRDCPANVASVDSGVAGSGAITISADRATIAIRPGAERGAAAGSEPATTLVKVDGAWRVDAVARRDESTTSARASAYARCWRAAGARIATSARDLTFAAADMPVIAVRNSTAACRPRAATGGSSTRSRRAGATRASRRSSPTPAPPPRSPTSGTPRASPPSSRVRARARAARDPRARLSRMRYCGIDVSATAANQQLCTLHERRGVNGGEVELVATFYVPGTVEAVARTRLRRRGGRGRRCAVGPSPRPARPRRSAARRVGLPDGRFERHRGAMRCCFAGACRCTPCRRPARRSPTGSAGSGSASALRRARAADRLPARRRRHRGRAHRHRCAALRAPLRDLSRCRVLLDDRPSAAAKRTPWGLQQRIAALRLRGVVDADGGLWHRTLDALDACAAAYAAYGLANGGGCWVGDPREGVIVLPVEELLARYDPLPPPSRSPLA